MRFDTQPFNQALAHPFDGSNSFIQGLDDLFIDRQGARIGGFGKLVHIAGKARLAQQSKGLGKQLPVLRIIPCILCGLRCSCEKWIGSVG